MFADGQTHFVARPQYFTPLDQTLKAPPNITMLGDAVHWMLPFAKEGANMTMHDVLESNECLVKDAFINIQKAMAACKNQMQVR